MLISVQSVQSRSFGVVDIDPNTGNVKKNIVPIRYQNVIFQKSGIIAQKSVGIYDAYSFHGQGVFCDAINPIFLENNMILITSNQHKCYILDYVANKLVFSKSGFDSILFFMGSNPQAIEYPPKPNFLQYLSTIDYQKNGAHLENLVAVKRNGKWGVINLTTGTLHADFIYPVMVQCAGYQIAAKDSRGITIRL